MEFSVLFVCTGNICRSPAAELLFRGRTVGLPITCSSAGTSGLSGHDMDAPSAKIVREYGVDPTHHVARRLTGAMSTRADLILTADSAHRSTVVQSEPMTFRRTFTIREFARLGAALPPLVGDVTPDALRDRVSAVAAQRGIVEAGAAGSDEIGDPYGGGAEVARFAIVSISAALDGVLHALGLRQQATAPPMRSARA